MRSSGDRDDSPLVFSAIALIFLSGIQEHTLLAFVPITFPYGRCIQESPSIFWQLFYRPL